MNKDTVEHSSDATDLLCIGSPIEGDCIIVSDKTALPLRCIKTNQALSEAEYGTHTLGWISPMINVLIFASLLLFLATFLKEENQPIFLLLTLVVTLPLTLGLIFSLEQSQGYKLVWAV